METWTFSYILMALLCVLSFRQPTWQRLLICLAFCAEFWVHAWLDSKGYLTDLRYYSSGAILTGFVLTGICLLAKPDKFTDRMVAACLASICLNIYGAIIYENSWAATSYNLAFYVLYMMVAFIFMQKKGVVDGGASARDSGFFMPYRKRGDLCREIHKEAQK